MTKAEARRLIRERVARLRPEERAAKSARIAHSVLGLAEVRAADVVMAFLALPDEVDTQPLIEGLWQQGKVVATPHTDVEGGALIPVRLRPGAAIQPAALGVPEPEVQEPVVVVEIDVVVVPGRAFDREGHRVGRGGGYYDRFLGRRDCRGLRLAVAYGCQVLETVPSGSADVAVEVLVTEHEVLRFPCRHGAK